MANSAGGIGSFGEVVFLVSARLVRTFEQLERSSRAIYADHETVAGKPASEFTGLALDEVPLTMVLNAALGVNPAEEAETLRNMLASGKAYPLIIGGRMWGNFTLREVSEVVNHTLGGGILISTVEVSLVEYVESLPGPGSAAAARDAANRSVTGKGGPEKVAGAKPPTRDCVFTPIP